VTVVCVCGLQDGNQFWKMAECYVRGSTIKYIRVAEDVIEKVPAEDEGSGPAGTCVCACVVPVYV
jgi:hypothetical protein